MLPVIAEGISSLVMGLIHKFLPDTAQEKKDALAAALQQSLIQSNIDIEQAKVNEAEASSGNVFASSWRPLIGYICGLSFAWQYFLQPLITYFAVLSGHSLPTLPHFDMAEMIPVLMGMLGLGSLRTYEKLNDRA